MYTIRFGVLPHDSFSDRVIVYNPQFGSVKIGPWGSRPVKPDANKVNRLFPFYENLEESIKKEGIRNPIFCNSIEQGTFCKYGTSRLWIAKKLGLEVPAIIADFDGRWSNLEQLYTIEDIQDKYVDQPTIIEVEENWMRIDQCRQ